MSDCIKAVFVIKTLKLGKILQTLLKNKIVSCSIFELHTEISILIHMEHKIIDTVHVVFILIFKQDFA
jgi:hypothetical protein